MSKPSILALVLAGGEGKRLYPLTTMRSKPAVPFGGRYRIIDFVLSNLVNSGIYSIYLLVQYKSQSLIDHLRRGWTTSPITPQHFVTVVPPQMSAGPEWFSGTADAVYQSLDLIAMHHPDLVAVFGADHIYRMDISQMCDFHLSHRADVTVAALPVAISEAHAFGVMRVDSEGSILEFREKPENPAHLSRDGTHCYASMGNYLFSTETLVECLHQCHRAGGKDFGRDVLPRLLKHKRVFAYNLGDNRVPGIKPYEEQPYWRDVGSIDAYYAAHQDLLGAEPRFDTFNVSWPIYSDRYLGPAARILGGTVENTLVGAASVIGYATVRNSVIGREVVIHDGAEVNDCVVMDYTVVGKNSRLKRAIIERYNVLPEGTEVGFNPSADRERFHVSENGIVVVPLGTRGGLARVY